MQIGGPGARAGVGRRLRVSCMSEFLQDGSPAALAAAIEANLIDNYLYFGRSPGGEVCVEKDLVRFHTPVPHRMFNGIMGAQLAGRDLAGRVEAALAPFRARGIPMIWWTGPGTRPERPEGWLAGSHLKHADDLPGMAVELAAVDEDVPAPDGLAVEEVETREALGQWAAAFVEGFALPPALAPAWAEFDRHLGVGQHLPWRRFLGR